MAKGKHAAALFEVIHADRRFGRSASPLRALTTPKWWFKGKAKAGDGAQAPASAGAVSSMPGTTAVASAQIGSSAPGSPTAEPIDYMPSVPGAEAAGPVDVRVDPDRQEISFRLTYNSAIVGGFALLVVLSLAYVIGRKMTRGPAPASAGVGMSTGEIRKVRAQPGVLDLQSAARGKTSSIAPDADESARIIDPTPVPATPASPPRLPKAPASVTDLVINQNFVLVQGYPPEEKAMAEDAAKMLNEAGIGAVIVKGLDGWPPTWCHVVGTQSFERTRNNPAYVAYVKSIMDVSAKHAGKMVKFKRFEPMPKRWTGVP